MRFKIVLLLCGLTLSSLVTGQDSEVKVSTPEKINWLTFNEAWDLNKSEPKLIFIDFYTDWCGWCKRMDNLTFKDSLIISKMNEGFYAVKFNAEQKEDVVVDGTTYSFVNSGRRGHHELAAQILEGKMSYPTFAFLESGQILTRIAGYQEPESMLKYMEFILLHHEDNTQTWENFSATYVSPYPDKKEEEE